LIKSGSGIYSLQILNNVEKLSHLLTLPKDIAKIIEVDQRQFIIDVQDEGSDLYKSFHKGYLKREIEIKQKMLVLTDVYEKESLERELRNYNAKLILQFHG